MFAELVLLVERFGKLDLPQNGESHRRVLAVVTYLRASAV